jgi:hypothetical protein
VRRLLLYPVMIAVWRVSLAAQALDRWVFKVWSSGENGWSP